MGIDLIYAREISVPKPKGSVLHVQIYLFWPKAAIMGQISRH